MAWYCDTSALLKLFIDEAESEVLRAYVKGLTLVASELVIVEVVRGARRLQVGLDLADLGAFHLVPIDREILLRASQLLPPGLRSLDAIHLSTAMSLGEACDGILVYDLRLQGAAVEQGLAVHAPGQTTP